MKVNLNGNSGSGTKTKEEEENASLASKGQQKSKQKKDISKVKCFSCGEMGHYASHWTLKKKDKDEKHDPKAAPGKIDENDFSMSAHASLGGRWGDIELLSEGLHVGRIHEESTSWIKSLLWETNI